MPYKDERAGLAALRAITQRGIVDEFRALLADRHSGQLPDLPPFEPCPPGNARSHILAIDGSNIYEPIPGALPATEAGIVSLGLVLIDMEKLKSLQHLPDSGAVNPRALQATETSEPPLATILPGRNAAMKNGTSPRVWFRKIINSELEKANLGGESFAETLHALLREERTIKCPDPDCEQGGIPLPDPESETACPACREPVWLTDGLRIHEHFLENEQTTEAHSRFRDALEILALMNAIRALEQRGAPGLNALKNTAFVMDGPLAAFGTIAVLAKGIREEFLRIQTILSKNSHGANLLVMSAIKSGAFVDHVEELDRSPEPDTRIPTSHMWLPDNEYIRSNVVAGSSALSKPWGEITYYGRPLIMKTAKGQRLVLNLAQPEAAPPLTDAPRPAVLNDAIATIEPLGVGLHQFLPLRRVHAHAAIPLRLGTDLIKSLAP